MIIKCAIVDDEPLALGLLESYVKKNAIARVVWCILQCHSGNGVADRASCGSYFPGYSDAGIERTGILQNRSRKYAYHIYYSLRTICIRRV